MPYYLNDAVLFEILLRVPIKSLLRLKSVSRQWLTMISDPVFAKARLRMSLQEPTPPQSLLMNSWVSSSFVSLDFNSVIRGWPELVNRDIGSIFRRHETRGLWLVGGESCHGLLWLESLHSNEKSYFILYNPTARESRGLPEHPHLGTKMVCGLGYDIMHDDYKLLTSTHHRDDSVIETLHIYSLNSNSWRRIGELERDRTPGISQAIYVNGYFHWLHRPLGRIISFNIAEEQLYDDMLPMPCFNPPTGFARLSTIKAEGEGESSLVGLRNNWDQRTLEFWIMKNCGVSNSTWTKLCYFPSKYYIHGFFPLIKDGKVVILCAQGGDGDDRIAMYPKIFPLPFLKDQPYRLITTPYVESLVPLRVIN